MSIFYCLKVIFKQKRKLLSSSKVKEEKVQLICFKNKRIESNK